MTLHEPSPAAPPRTSNALRIVLLAVGSAVLVAMVVGTGLGVAHALNTDDSSGTYTVGTGFDAVDIHSDSGDVRVQYADVDKPTVAFDQAGTDLSLSYRVTSGELRIRVSGPHWGWWGWNLPRWGWHGDPALSLTLPRAMDSDAVDLDIDATAGIIDLAGAYGDISVDSTAGTVRMSGSARTVRIEKSAGNVRLIDYAVADSLISETTAGNSTFDLRALPQRIDARSTAGNVRAALPRGSYRIEAHTLAGDLDQQVSSDVDSQRVYRFETTAGNIDLRER